MLMLSYVWLDYLKNEKKPFVLPRWLIDDKNT